MQKEILTVEDCKKRLLEANDVYSKEARSAIGRFVGFALVVSLVLISILCLPLSMVSGKIPIFLYLILGLLCAFVPVVLFCAFFVDRMKAKKRYQYIEHKGIEIVEDTLKRAYEDGETRGRRYHLFYVLEFEKHGRVRVSEGKHYAWSKLYSMSDRGIYNTSVAGDTFYIVRLKGDDTRRVLEFYNAKLFELCPDGTEKKPRSSWRDSVIGEE